jgi:hypothetical protein
MTTPSDQILAVCDNIADALRTKRALTPTLLLDWEFNLRCVWRELAARGQMLEMPPRRGGRPVLVWNKEQING